MTAPTSNTDQNSVCVDPNGIKINSLKNYRRYMKMGIYLKYAYAAMKKARYEILPDDGTFYAEIPGFNGIYANSDTLESCRDELEEVLEEWILLRIRLNLPLPVVDGISLSIMEAG